MLNFLRFDLLGVHANFRKSDTSRGLHRILFEEAIRLGAEMRLDAEVADVDIGINKVFLRTGDEITGDAIIGADGTSW